MQGLSVPQWSVDRGTYHKFDILVECAEVTAALKGSGYETYRRVFAFPRKKKHQKCMKAPRDYHKGL